MMSLGEVLKDAGFAGGSATDIALPQKPEITDLCAECLKSGGKGFIRIPPYYREDGYLVGWSMMICDKKSECKKIKEEHDRIVARAQKLSNLPDELKGKRVNNFVTSEPWQKHMKDVSVRFIKQCEDRDFKGWLFFSGQSGCGKTHLCSAIANKLLSEGKIVRYCRWMDLMRKVKRFDYEALEDAKRCPILYLDDLYKFDPSPEEAKATFELIDHRYANGLPTLITSERSSNELMSIDQGTVGRILEKCKDDWAAVSGSASKNQRLKQAGF